MGEPEENGRTQHHYPRLQSYMEEDGHGEPAIENLLTESRGNRQRKIGKQFHLGLRQDPLCKGLNRAPRFNRNSPHAPQVQPLKRRNRCGADNRGSKNPGSIMHRQTKLGGRKSVRPCAPCHNCDGKPLKRNSRRVEGEALHRADVWQRQQFLHAHSSAPRQNHAEHKENQPDVPGHPRMRTLSAAVAQVTKVPKGRSISDNPAYQELTRTWRAVAPIATETEATASSQSNYGAACARAPSIGNMR